MGLFTQPDNAHELRKTLQSHGVEAVVVAQGEAGEQRYLVVAGGAATPEGLNPLRRQLQDQTGTLGFPILNPVASSGEVVNDALASEEQFDPPRSPLLLVQTGEPPVGGESVGTSPAHGYDARLFPTPREEVPSNAGFTAGDLQIIPTLGASLGYDDNITSANTGEISSWFYMISPAIRAELPTDHSVLAVTAAYNMTEYEDSPVDSTDAWYVRSDWMWDISTRQALGLFVGYTEDYDQRGVGRRQGDLGLLPFDPDHWERFDYGGRWAYGAVGSRGQLTLQAGGSDITYTNNRDGFLPGDPGTTALDRGWWYYGGSFYWRVAPKTSLVATYLHSDISYDESEDSDSTEDSYLLGVTWDATARTSGLVQYGVQEKDFADPTVEDYNGPTWRAAVKWRPRTYSMFTLSGTRNTQEPDGNGKYVVRQDLILSWAHDWNTWFRTIANVGYGEDDYRPDGRDEDRSFWGLAAIYGFSQHFRFGASVNSYSRNSGEQQYDFDKRIYLLTVEASF